MGFYVSAIALICVSCLCALVMFIVLARFGEWRKGAAALFLGTPEQQLSHHLTHRSLAAMSIFAALLIFDSSVVRSTYLDLFVVMDENVNVFYLRFVILLLALSGISIAATTFVRAWRVRMRHMYYVVLRNAGWSKLMDPSLEDSLSFWVKYKAMLTSDRGMFALVSLWVAGGAVACVSLHHHLRTLHIVAHSSIAVMCLASIALVYGCPKCDCLLRREILTLACLNLVGTVLELIIDIQVAHEQYFFLLGQSIETVIQCSSFFVAFVWTPLRFVKAKEMTDSSLKKMSGSSSSAKLHIVLSDVSKLSEFMQYCCDHFCAENLLALLEIKAFKRMVRKQLGKELKRREKKRTSKKAVDSEILKAPASVSADAEDCSSQHDSESDALAPNNSMPSATTSSTTNSVDAAEKNLGLFSRAVMTDLQLGEHIDERWTRWDLGGFVRLSALGCRSAIVSGAGDARSKALSLCQKYFEWDSEFSLNISYQNRSKVLGLAGKDAAVALEPVALLYVFDEAMCDVFDNLNDPLTPFLKAHQ